MVLNTVSKSATLTSGIVTLVICAKVFIDFKFYIVAAAIGKPRARVPYSSLSPSSVKKFSAELKFGPPSSFGIKNLRNTYWMLLKTLNLLVCTSINILTDFNFYSGNSTLPTMPLLEHSYCKLPSEPIKVPNEVKPTGGTLITSLNSNIDTDVPLESKRVANSKSRKTSKKITKKPKKGSLAEILYMENVVAKATILEGSLLHGKNITSGYIKVSMKEIEQKDLQVPLQIKGPFDDDLLQCGIIIAWKISDMLCINHD